MRYYKTHWSEISKSSAKPQKNLSEKTREENTNVPWRDVMRMRAKIVHHYFRLNLEIIWRTVTEDIPALKIEINKILKAFGEK